MRNLQVLVLVAGAFLWVQAVAGPEHKIVASDGLAYDFYGHSVAIDGNRAVVGAYSADNRGLNSGTAYVYTRAGLDWVETELPNDARESEGYGAAVAIDGDTLAVGATYSNAVYIYTYDGQSWSLEQKLTQAEGCFGDAIAIDGDTLVIGAFMEDAGGGECDGDGAAYIYTRSDSVWSFQKRLIAPVASEDITPHYGCSVAIDGGTVVVGALRYSYSGLNSGAAYVYTGSGSTWDLQGDLGAAAGTDLTAGDFFGCSVDIDGDSVLVGSYRDDEQAVQAGSAYLFIRDESVWSLEQKVSASNATGGGKHFGYSVSLSNDQAVISGCSDSIDSKTVGAAHYFVYRDLGWVEEDSFILASDGEETDAFGCAVSLSNDVVLIGAFRDDDKGTDAGAAYLYTLCRYDIVGDFNDDCRVNFQDFVILSNNWMGDMGGLMMLSDNWLVDCIDNPGDGACVVD